MVVVVLMKSCQVLEYSNTGPVTAHVTTNKNASMVATGLPAAFVTLVENLLKKMEIFFT
jgi:hypothetical protein